MWQGQNAPNLATLAMPVGPAPEISVRPGRRRELQIPSGTKGRPMARGGAATKFPGTPDQLAEMLADPKAAAAAMGGTPAEWRQFQDEYAAAVGATDPSIGVQVKEQVQRELTNWLKGAGSGAISRLNLEPGAASASARNALYAKKAPGVKADGIFDSIGDMVRAIRPGADPANDKLGRLRNAMGSDIPADGGFLVPEQFRSELLAVALEQAIVRPRATVVPMSSKSLAIPTADDTSHTSSLFGGVTAAWTEESAQLDDSEPTFGRIQLEAKKLTAYTEAPNELVADAPGFEAIIARIFPAAVAWYEDSAFIAGSGVGEPMGYLNAPAAVSVAKEAGQAADTIVWENIVKMYARMLPGSLSRAVWVANPDTFPELATMALSVGTGGGPVWIGWNSSGADAPPMSILGRPLMFTEHAPTLGDAGDISFVDLAYYLIGDRQTMAMDASPHYKFRNDQTAFRLIERCDGRLWVQSAITPENGPNTLSPVVKIAARA
jgi:HK97 family phage major capsid protein